MNLRSPAVGNITLQLGTAASQLLTVPIFINYWGVNQYGLWLSITALCFLLSFSDFGFLSVSANSINANNEKIASNETIKIFNTAIFSYAAGALLSIPTLNTALLIIFKEEYFYGVLAYSAYWILFSTCIFISNCTRSKTTYYKYPLINSSFKIIELITVSISLALGASKDTISIAFLAIAATNALAIYKLFSKEHGIKLSTHHFDINLYKSCLNKSLHAFIFPAAIAAWLQITIIIFFKLYSAEMAAFFSTSRTLSRLVIQVINITNSSFWGRLSLAISQKNHSTLESTWITYKKTVNLLLICSSLILLAVGPYIYTKWTSFDLTNHKHDFYTLSAAALLTALWQSRVMLFTVSNNHKEFSFFYLLAIILGLLAITMVGHKSITTFFTIYMLVEFFMSCYAIKKSCKSLKIVTRKID